MNFQRIGNQWTTVRYLASLSSFHFSTSVLIVRFCVCNVPYKETVLYNSKSAVHELYQVAIPKVTDDSVGQCELLSFCRVMLALKQLRQTLAH